MLDYHEYLFPAVGDVISTDSSRSTARVDFTLQPSESFHPVKYGIQGSGADLVPVATKFLKHPLSDNRTFYGVVKDVDLPKSEKDFPLNCFSGVCIHGRSFLLRQS